MVMWGDQLVDSKNPLADAWIAAAALQLNVPLVTHNAGDYRAVDKLTILTAAGS
jgi:predicted nucleic acid-binding protein